jgi:hypothetical protein
MDIATAPDVFTAMLHAIDAKDWDGVRRAFDDQVTMDYHSLFGIPAAVVRADDQVREWRAFASGFSATQHITGPMIVRPSDVGAIAHTHIRAYHRMAGAPGGDVWMVAGHYEVRLRPVDSSWKITGITLTVFYQDGNLEIPKLARTST